MLNFDVFDKFNALCFNKFSLNLPQVLTNGYQQNQETDKCLFVHIYSKTAKLAPKTPKQKIFIYEKSQFTTTELFTSQQKFDILKGKLERDRISLMMLEFSNLRI